MDELEAFKLFRSGKKLPLSYMLKAGISSLLFDPWKLVILNMPGPLGYKLRQIYFSRVLKELGFNSLIDVGVQVTGPQNVSIGDYTWIDSYVRLESVMGDISIGNRVHVGSGAVLSGFGGLEIGDYVGIGSGAKIYSQSETPVLGKRLGGPMIPEEEKGFKCEPIVIQKEVMVGAGAVILPGVTLGEGAVVGANSLVTKNVPHYTIVMGVPARIAGKRDKVDIKNC